MHEPAPRRVGSSAPARHRGHRTPRRLRRTGRARAATTTAVLSVVAFGTVSTVVAAFVAVTGTPSTMSAGSVAITDDDGGAAMLSITGGALGASDTSCVTLSSTSTLPSTLRHYATASGSAAPYLDVRVTKGTSSTGFDDCTGFVPDPPNYRGKGAGVVYDGPLSGLGTAWSSGVVDPAGPGGGPGGGYAPAVAATTGLVNSWRLGDSAVRHTFTGTSGTTLQSSSGESGGPWVKHAPSGAGGDIVLTGTGQGRRSGAPSTYYASAAPASADYAVEADVVTATRRDGDGVAVLARVDTATLTYYAAQYRAEAQGSRWVLLKSVGGTVTELGSYAQVLAVGTTHRVRLRVQGSQLTATVDGVQRLQATDSAITAAGRAGIRLGHTADAPTGAGNNLQVDDVRMVDAAVPTTFAASAGSVGGTWFNGPVPVAGALGGDDDRAMSFDGVNDRGRVTRQISDDFTIAFWFRSTQGISTTQRWFYGAGLVDAEVSGAADDFGVGLLADGRVVAGVGEVAVTETNVVSPPGFNDGQWHHVAFTRVSSSGAMALYVDGTPAGTATGTTGTKTDSATLTLGASNTTINFFQGALDEVTTHDRALSATEVATLYASQTPDTAAGYADKLAATTGRVSTWRLGENPTGGTFADSTGTANGTWYNSVTATAGIPGSGTNRAAAFNGSTTYGQVPRQLANDFTIAFWFRATRGNGDPASDWWDGDGLVDGDFYGYARDYGVNLASDGRIKAGVGTGTTTQYTIRSGPGYHDGRWHHVAFTRNRTTGTIALYVDGTFQESLNGGTAVLDEAATLTLGANNNGNKYLLGALDEVSLHNRALTATEVALLASTTRPAEVWTTGESHVYRVTTTIRNDPAAAGTSGTAALRWEARNR